MGMARRHVTNSSRFPTLLKSDLECPRSALELYTWVRRIHCEFGSTADGKSALRERSEPYVKEFLEEIWPLANYAWFFFRERNDLRFQPVIGNQRYDALLLDQSGAALCRFEVTQALYGEVGYQDRLRREHLELYRHAPLTGPGNGRNLKSGEISESWGECIKHTEAIEVTFKKIRAAIDAKVSKAYTADTGLIVEFQGIHLQRPADQGALDLLAKSILCELACQFSEFVLIDEIARFGFRYPRQGNPAF